MIRVAGAHFLDEHGRRLLLRGVNLGGSSKLPTVPDGMTHRPEALADPRDVSFVGRPFPLEEADEHFARLRSWGMTFLRFLITWEAVEHDGPGAYDRAYLDYLEAVVARAGDYGLRLFIDPHQDVWSRFSGGDGAPGWTLEAAGMVLERLAPAGAALVHAFHPPPYPRMIWPTNADRLATATMFALFFGGNQFAPHLRVDGEPIQEYLQHHYCAALQQVAARLSRFDHVVGYGTLNEPLRGYVGVADLTQPFGGLRHGPMPTPLQGMALGAGLPQEVDVWDRQVRGPVLMGREMLNRDGVTVWREGCPWAAHGVWDVADDGNPRLLRPDYFARVADRPVDFAADFLKPFLNRVGRAVQKAAPGAVIFVEGPYREPLPAWEPADVTPIVNASHWYDAATLFLKRYIPYLGVNARKETPVLGRRRVDRHFASALRLLKEESATRLGGVPTLLGEFGIPFDMHDKAAYHTGDFSRQVAALDRTYRALDANLLSGTVWNYTADNSNAHGDGWNEEDLSIFSRDQQDAPWDLDSGGRALRAAVRPYPICTAGEPLGMAFDLRRRRFSFAFRHDPAVTAPTVLFIPSLQYPRGYRVTVSDGDYQIDWQAQTLTYIHSHSRDVHALVIEDFGA